MADLQLWMPVIEIRPVYITNFDLIINYFTGISKYKSKTSLKYIPNVYFKHVSGTLPDPGPGYSPGGGGSLGVKVGTHVRKLFFLMRPYSSCDRG
jgi:hypothetical protein